MMANILQRSIACFCSVLIVLTACNRKNQEPSPDRPRLTPNVVLRDIRFRSAALNRDMQYRVVMPAIMAAGAKLPAVYLLHGGAGSFRDWSNYSDSAKFAEQGLILVMPEGDESYYMNSVEQPQDRYEDYIVNDLIADVESKFPVGTGRANRVIVGVSMGGFGAIKLAISHPDLFVFAGGISSAIVVCFPSSGFRSGSTTARSLDRGEARRAMTVTLLLSLGRLIQPRHRIYFSPVVIRRGCYQQTAISPPCWRSAIFATNSTCPQVATTGTNGKSGCRLCFRPCGSTSVQTDG